MGNMRSPVSGIIRLCFVSIALTPAMRMDLASPRLWKESHVKDLLTITTGVITQTSSITKGTGRSPCSSRGSKRLMTPRVLPRPRRRPLERACVVKPQRPIRERWRETKKTSGSMKIRAKVRHAHPPCLVGWKGEVQQAYAHPRPLQMARKRSRSDSRSLQQGMQRLQRKSLSGRHKHIQRRSRRGWLRISALLSTSTQY